jgi:alpha-maltose-1-phosphate synthase
MTGANVVCVAPVLPADVRQYTCALRDAGLLRLLAGACAYHDRGCLAAILRWAERRLNIPLYALTESRRLRDEVPLLRFKTCPWPELGHRLALRLRLRRSGPFASDLVFAAIDRKAAARIRPSDRLVIGREDACRASFRAARRAGAATLYDLPTAHQSVVKRVLLGERDRYPAASSELEVSQEFAPHRTARKDAELASADHVVVASEFVRGGLTAAGINTRNITVIPYGCDPGRPYRPWAERKPIVLSVGRLSLRKGTLHVLAAWKRLRAHRTHRLVLIGTRLLAPRVLAEYGGMFEHIPHLPRSQLWDYYHSARVFVFPAIADGFGLVLNEAMSCGTPVIASAHTGAPGFIQSGVQGLLHPHGDDDGLAAHLDWMLSHPRETEEMSRAAYAFAQAWGWSHYRARFVSLVASLLTGKGFAQ